jgi:hypothetical protein
MDPKLSSAGARRRLTGAVVVAVLLGVGAFGLVRAQQPAPAPPNDQAGPPPEESAPLPVEATPGAAPAAPEPTKPAGARPGPVAAVTMGGKPVVEPDTVPPPEPAKPVRSPTAVIQALDKVTAETMRFAAPVGRKVRYKNLIFTVKACETTGLDDPQPQSSAYLTIESQPRESVGPAPPIKQVFKGWMFATAPGLHPLEHPVYDAWLIACSASTPVT